MLRLLSSCLLLLLGVSRLPAAIFPDQLGAVKHDAVKASAPRDPLFEEYGFEAGEQTAYESLSVTAWRFKDSTGAMAAFQALRPADARPDKLDKLAAAAGRLLVAAHGNYLFQFAGGVPSRQQYAQLIAGLPKLEQSPLPVLSTYLPAAGLTPNSERYIVGPVSLEKFDPGIAPSVAAFHTSAEAQYGRYGDMNLAVFSYPTPGIARERADAFQKLPGAVVKRTGPLVAVTMNPPSPDAAEKLLSKVNYQAQLVWNEKPPVNEVQSMAKMILSIFKLAGFIIVFCFASGLAFAGFRVLSRRMGKGDSGEAMVTLNLGRK